MKKLMFAMIAALSFAVVAQDAGGPKPEGQQGARKTLRDRAAMSAQRGMMPRGAMAGDMRGDPAVMAVMNPKVAEKIGLSAEVRDQLKKIDQGNREKVRELQTKTRAAMERQAKLMKAEKIDEGAVMAAIDELFDCRKEMAKSQTRRVIAVKSLITPEQLAKAAEAMKELRSSRRGNRPGAGRGQESEGKPGNKPGNKPEGKPEGDVPPPPAE